MRDKFFSAISQNAPIFGLEIGEADSERLFRFYEIVQRESPLLHLVAPSPVEEFVKRHILESLVLLKFLPNGASITDVGAGAGLPSIPCLLVREDISAILIESKQKKALYLERAVDELGIADRIVIVNKQFEEAAAETEFITARALDKFTSKLPRLLRWGRGRKMLLFAGEALGEALSKLGAKPERMLLPLSERRFLYRFKTGGK